MAKKVTIEMSDDTDGSRADQTVPLRTRRCVVRDRPHGSPRRPLVGSGPRIRRTQPRTDLSIGRRRAQEISRQVSGEDHSETSHSIEIRTRSKTRQMTLGRQRRCSTHLSPDARFTSESLEVARHEEPSESSNGGGPAPQVALDTPLTPAGRPPGDTPQSSSTTAPPTSPQRVLSRSAQPRRTQAGRRSAGSRRDPAGRRWWTGSTWWCSGRWSPAAFSRRSPGAGGGGSATKARSC